MLDVNPGWTRDGKICKGLRGETTRMQKEGACESCKRMNIGVLRLLQYSTHDVLRPASERAKCRRGREACVVVMQASQGQGLDPSSDTDQSQVN